MSCQDIYQQLTEKDCIKKGHFILKNGQTSDYYVDLKSVISYPNLVKNIGDRLYELLDDFDIICGIPYGALPIASYISTTYNKPLIYVRDKVKTYGTELLIEGRYKKEDRCAIIDDVFDYRKIFRKRLSNFELRAECRRRRSGG